MHCVLFLVLLYTVKYVQISSASCSVSKYDDGNGNWLRCSNTNLVSVQQLPSHEVVAIAIVQSTIPSIPKNSFSKFTESLVTLNLHGCGIYDISPDAFAWLTRLRKLSLSNNNISHVHDKWFEYLTSLEQLDLSFNAIQKIESTVFIKLMNLRTLHLNDNKLNCLETNGLKFLRNLAVIRIQENPLSFDCRKKVILWLVDHKINYISNSNGAESWLDNVLLLCHFSDPNIVDSEDFMECVVLNFFNQLLTALISSESYFNVPSECTNERTQLSHCVSKSGQSHGVITNGKAVKMLLLTLRDKTRHVK